MQLIFILQSLFSIWMLVDAIRRGVPQYWYLVVLIPFGEVAYFIAIVLPDLKRTGKLKKWFSRPPSLSQLKLAYEETPSQHNRLRLAQSYHDAGKIAEGGMLFEEVLDASPLEREALYGFAKCAWAAGETEASIEALKTLVDHDLNYLETMTIDEIRAPRRDAPPPPPRAGDLPRPPATIGFGLWQVSDC